ncbi:MAG: outer membrane protein [bacterium]
MKKKLLFLVFILVLVVGSGSVLAQDLDNLNEKELEVYNDSVTIAENTHANFRTGINFGTLTHSIEDGGLNIENEFKQQYVTGQLSLNLKIGTKFIREANIYVEKKMKDNEKELNQKYSNTDESFSAEGSNDNNVEDYNKTDVNFYLPYDLRSNKNHLYFGLGYQQEEKTLTSKKGTFDVDDAGSEDTSSYNNFNYNYKAKKPYLSLRAYSPEIKKEGGYVFDNELKVFPYITSENETSINNQKISGDFTGWGLSYSLGLNKKITENILLGLGYNYRRQNLTAENEESGKEFLDTTGIPTTQDYDYTETMTQSNHLVYANLTFQF